MDFDQIKQYQLGFLTLEILLAMAIMIIALSAAILMLFCGQSLAADSRLNSEALNYAQKLLEKQRALGLKDFRLVNSASEAERIFNGKVIVSSHSPFVKNVSIEVEWGMDGRLQKVGLETLIADYNGTAGNDTCDSNLSGDWAHPQVKEFDFFELTGVASSTISDIDAYKGKLYVTVGGSATSTDPTFFIFDITDKNDPKKISNSNIKNRFAAMTINGNYAFTANMTSVDQLKIINIANPDDLGSIAKLELKNKITGEDCKGLGESIFYKNGYIYLGLSKDSNCPEFNIIDVSTPANPRLVSGFEIDTQINDIYAKGDYVFLAHPANLASGVNSAREQVTILNISNPDNPQRVSGIYYNEGFGGYGKSLRSIGDKIYFGRTTSHISNPPDAIGDFFIFDNQNPGTTTISILGLKAFSRVGSANEVLVRDYLAFVLLGTASQGGDLRILNVADMANIIEEKIIDLPNGTTGSGGKAMDCEGNYLYVVSVDGADRSYLSIITAE
ncbi:MAG: hypothetical protein WA093_02425 [Minisyncoccales bacterium]